MTNKARQIEWTAFCLAIFLLAAGCAHEVRQVPPREEAAPAPPAPATSPLALQAEGFDQRMSRLQALLDGDMLNAEDRLLAQNLLAAYQAVERASSPTQEETRNLIELLVSNLTQLDERYFSKERTSWTATWQETIRASLTVALSWRS